jgi:hypothetical protein
MQTVLLVSALTALVGTIIASIFGMIWYSQKCFGRAWAEIMGMDMNDQTKVAEGKKSMPALILLNALAMFVMFFVFSFLGVFMGQLNIVGSLTFAAILWFGFAVPISLVGVLWTGKTKRLQIRMFLINSGYYLVVFLAAGLAWALIYPKFLI